jgi:hypothetical protein
MLMIDGDFILELDEFIPKDTCDKIIKLFENEPHKGHSSIIHGDKMILDLERKNSIQFNIIENETWGEINHYLNDKINDALSLYKREFCDYFKRYDENPKFINYIVFNQREIKPGALYVQRVTPNSHFRWHIDEGVGTAHTCIIYLNDIDEEHGGATEFANGKKIQPKIGKLLLFPATWSNVHRGCFVTKHKYMITCATHFVYKSDNIPFIYKSDIHVQKTPIFK